MVVQQREFQIALLCYLEDIFLKTTDLLANSSDDDNYCQQLLRVNLFTSKQIELHFMPYIINHMLLTDIMNCGLQQIYI